MAVTWFTYVSAYIYIYIYISDSQILYIILIMPVYIQYLQLEAFWRRLMLEKWAGRKYICEYKYLHSTLWHLEWYLVTN